MRRALPALLMVIVACSSSNSGGPAGATASTRSSASGPDVTEFCSTFVTHYAQLSGRGIAGDASSLQSAFGELGPVLDELQRAAPTDIKTDVDRFVVFLRDYTDVLSKYGFDYSRVESEGTPDEKAKLNGGDPTQISSINNIQHFVRDHCTNVTLPSDFSDFS